MLFFGSITLVGVIKAALIGLSVIPIILLVYFLGMAVILIVSRCQAFVNDQTWKCPDYLKRYILILYTTCDKRYTEEQIWRDLVSDYRNDFCDGIIKPTLFLAAIGAIVGAIVFAAVYLFGILLLIIGDIAALIYGLLLVKRNEARAKKAAADNQSDLGETRKALALKQSELEGVKQQLIESAQRLAEAQKPAKPAKRTKKVKQ